MQLPQMDWTPIIAAAVSLLAAGIGWAANWLRRQSAATTEKTKVETTLLRVGEFVALLAGQGWTEISPVLQRSLADGKITAEERIEIENVVKRLSVKFTDDSTLEGFAKALGLPFAGLIALIAAKLIDVWTKAHDPDLVNTSSPLSFPVPAPEQNWATDPVSPDQSFGG